MKYLKIITIVCFAIILIIPVVFFNFTPDAISEIDNRKLTENPFSGDREGDLTQNIENYVNDRIGLRDKMILSYTVLNDRLFGKMVHPTYSYGKNGYVFASGITTVSYKYSEYHEAFADMIEKIQNYCDERDIPFVFVFNPAKPAVLSQYISDGINYDRTWVDKFFAALDERGIRYVDNTVTMKEKMQEGIEVFNKKYDANHWNDLGAYYGTKEIAEELKKDFPTVHITDEDELIITQKTETTLPVSLFPINESVPDIRLKSSINQSDSDAINTAFENKTDAYFGELELDEQYHVFGNFINNELREQGAPKLLIFEGSYMNKNGYAYLANGVGECTLVHAYRNIFNLPYYFNIFQPDCVVFEVAEYAMTDDFFKYNSVKEMKLNPPLNQAESSAVSNVRQTLNTDSITVQQGQTLTEIKWNIDEKADYAWLVLGEDEYDLSACDGGYEATITNEIYNANRENIRIVTLIGDSMCVYELSE